MKKSKVKLMTLTWPKFLTWGTCLISSFDSFKFLHKFKAINLKAKKQYCGAININAKEQYCGAIKIIAKEQYCGAINIIAKEIGFVDFSA